MTQRRRVALVGATASGKSTVALAAARQVSGAELISVDAMQVYRGMDIGTAKPTSQERSEVVHHCIDIIDPADEFTVAEFQRACRSAAESFGGPALYVGGTGLYHRAVIDDLTLPGEWPEIRAALDANPDTHQLFQRLEAIDPHAVVKIEPTNRRRIVRALEVCMGSGRPFSSFGPGLETYPANDVVQIGLRWDRAVLARRIEQRVRQMFAAGLVDEVRQLSQQRIGRTAGQAIGYKELFAVFAGDSTVEEARELIVTSTRQLAARQDKWFRRDPRIRWIDVDDDPLVALPTVIEALTA